MGIGILVITYPYIFVAFQTSSLVLYDSYFAYLGFSILANLIYFIFSIVAAVRARKGIFMYFILFGPYAYQKVYSKKNRLKYENEDHHPNMEQKVNTPPI